MFNKIANSILSYTSHRPYELPNEPWKYYQEWNKVVFLHWEIPADLLIPIIPKDVSLDTFDGKAYVSLVPFMMEQVRPRGLPAWSFISTFQEVNLRTYVIKDGVAGVYFLSIEAGKRLAAYICRKLSGLPYEYASMHRGLHEYRSHNDRTGNAMQIQYTIGDLITTKSSLDLWLTERYCLYVNWQDTLHRCDIHHKAWDLQAIDFSNIAVQYSFQGLIINGAPDLIHYSPGVQVVAWNKVKL